MTFSTTPITRTGTLPSMITCPIGSSPLMKKASRALPSITASCVRCVTLASLKPTPAVKVRPLTWK
ncbi:hypothetical protein D3C86_2185050 [compost metagenome]